MRTSLLFVAAFLLLTGCPTDEPDTTWRPVTDVTDTGWKMNIWGPSKDRLFSPGGSLDEGTLIEVHGTDATLVTLPEATGLLNWNFGFGPDDVTVVGNGGTIFHYDGDTWSVQDSGTDQDLWGVWGTASDDLWAVGGTARGTGGIPTILRFDGSVWSSVMVPTLMTENVRAFFKVWGSGENDVYIVGNFGLLLHWNGSTFEEIDVGLTDDLIAVWGTSPDDIVVVGGRSNAVVAVWNGTEWRSDNLAPLSGLNGVWMREPGVAHIVGLRGTIAVFDAATLTYEEALPDEILDYHSVFGVGGELFAVGGNLAVPTGAQGMAWRRQLADGE